jgi:hypothetical protein
MDRRSLTASALVAACLLLGGPTAQAQAFFTSDITDFNLGQSTTSYNGGQNFHISTTGNGWASYRWVDDPNVGTVISGNSCGSLANYGSHTYNAHVTAWRQLFWHYAGTCFVLRGRVVSGQGSMYNHDGRLER